MSSTLLNEDMIEDEINLRDYWRILVRHRALILVIFCAIALTSIIVTLLQPNIYESKTILIPLGKPASNLQSALGELGSLLPLGRGAVDSPAARLLAILQSRTLAEDVIQRLNLLPLLFAHEWDVKAQKWQVDKPPTMQDVVQMLGTLVTSLADERKGIITIAVQHTDPQLAAAIANQYIEALQRALNENAFSSAKKNRVFIEAQLHRTQGELVAAEEALQQFEHVYGIVALDAQTEAAVNAIAGLEGQIMAKEIHLGVLQRTLTGSNQEVYLVREELRGLRAQLARLQQGTPVLFPTAEAKEQGSQLLLSLDKAPEIKLQYARLQRETLLQNKLFGLLAQQLEQARVEESRDETAFQLLDSAIPPEKKIKPRRGLIVVLSMVLGIFVGVLGAFCREFFNTVVQTREQVERQTGMTLLATIPPLAKPRQHQGAHRELSSEVSVTLPYLSDVLRSEALCYLHARLKHSNGTGSIQALLLTSPSSEEETTSTLVHLALVTAGIGERTLLVDSNVRSPLLHTLLQCPATPGLVDVLTDPEGWKKSIHTTSVPRLHLLPTGITTSQSIGSLGSAAFGILLAHLRLGYDTILFASPPVLSCMDAAVLSTQVDATCLLLTCGVSRLEAIMEAKTTLEAVQGKVLGAVLTDFRL